MTTMMISLWSRHGTVQYCLCPDEFHGEHQCQHPTAGATTYAKWCYRCSLCAPKYNTLEYNKKKVKTLTQYKQSSYQMWTFWTLLYIMVAKLGRIDSILSPLSQAALIIYNQTRATSHLFSYRYFIIYASFLLHNVVCIYGGFCKTRMDFSLFRHVLWEIGWTCDIVLHGRSVW